MSLKNLTLDVESIALALSEEGGYEYYDIDDELKELAKNVSDMQAENDKLRRYAKLYAHSIDNSRDCYDCPYYDDPACDAEKVPMVVGCMLLDEMRELGVEP